MRRPEVPELELMVHFRGGADPSPEKRTWVQQEFLGFCQKSYVQHKCAIITIGDERPGGHLYCLVLPLKNAAGSQIVVAVTRVCPSFEDARRALGEVEEAVRTRGWTLSSG